MFCAGSRDSASRNSLSTWPVMGSVPVPRGSRGRTRFGGGARFGEPVREASLEDENLRRQEQWRVSDHQLHLPPPGGFLKVDSRVAGTGSRGGGIGEAPSAHWRSSVGGPDQ
jgi:hypothetical protein